MNFVSFAGNTYSMGLSTDSNARPVHNVTLAGFEISESEVTVAQYKACVDAGICTLPANSSGYCNYAANRVSHPVNCLAWDQALAFAQWVGGALPTEAQWEYAAKSKGQNITYPWGNTFPDCTYADFYLGLTTYCQGQGTTAVCSYPLGNTADGLCDMSGNLWEWMMDEWHNNYNGAPINGSAWCTDPSCTTVVVNRVIRGGSWANNENAITTTYRNPTLQTSKPNYIGFRVARPMSQQCAQGVCTRCGDGVVNGTEVCDDGNRI
jgi:formylglycine-generating enzyme required for sulfatase activity